MKYPEYDWIKGSIGKTRKATRKLEALERRMMESYVNLIRDDLNEIEVDFGGKVYSVFAKNPDRIPGILYEIFGGKYFEQPTKEIIIVDL